MQMKIDICGIVTLESWHKGSHALSIQSPVMGEESMRLSHWGLGQSLAFFSVLRRGYRLEVRLCTTPQ